MDRCKFCSDNSFYIIKLKCKHKICISCLLNLNNLKCKLCNHNFYDELSDDMLKIFANKK